jgi:hypothetical protein
MQYLGMEDLTGLRRAAIGLSVADCERQAMSFLGSRGREQNLEAGSPPTFRCKADRRLQII